jgi:DNA-binding CsgD family transcriptional regulator
MQEQGDAVPMPSTSGEVAIERGRDAAVRSEWEKVFTNLHAADADSLLAAEDLEFLAVAAVLLGQVEVAIDALQRAHQLFLDRGDLRRAVRCGFWVGFNFFSQGDYAQGGGWLARIIRLCEQIDSDCPEHGYPLVAVAYQQIRVQGAYADGEVAARRAIDFGRRFGDPDLLGLAQVLLGGALIRQERATEGLAMLDETMVGVLSGEMSAIVAGSVYCSMIQDCEEISEFRRVREWTEALTKWCDRQKGMVTFAGECLVHRATIKQHIGAWPEAVEEVALARNRASLGADRHVMGMALYRLGELHRVRGEFGPAIDAYQGVGEWGHDPHPGLALLRLAEGKTEVAVSAIRRALGELPERSRRAKLLPAAVEIMLAAGEINEAKEASDELAEIATVFATPGLEAEADQARGAVLLAEGRPGEAITPLRRAERRWMNLGFPYNEGRLRVLIAEACRALGDFETANSEMKTARQIFSRLGAAQVLDRLEGRRAAHGLTGREIEVLRLVAAGKTNQVIADELFLAVKTVDRHVSNIFAKIGVTSRAAATAYAFRNELV